MKKIGKVLSVALIATLFFGLLVSSSEAQGPLILSVSLTEIFPGIDTNGEVLGATFVGIAIGSEAYWCWASVDYNNEHLTEWRVTGGSCGFRKGWRHLLRGKIRNIGMGDGYVIWDSADHNIADVFLPIQITRGRGDFADINDGYFKGELSHQVFPPVATGIVTFN